MRHVAIRLDESKYRRLRIAIAEKDTTIQKAVESAIDQYIAESAFSTDSAQPPRRDYRGFLRDTDVMELMEKERRQELARDRSRV